MFSLKPAFVTEIIKLIQKYLNFIKITTSQQDYQVIDLTVFLLDINDVLFCFQVRGNQYPYSPPMTKINKAVSTYYVIVLALYHPEIDKEKCQISLLPSLDTHRIQRRCINYPGVCDHSQCS